MSFDLELLAWLVGTAVLLSPVLFVLRRRGRSWPYLACFFVLTMYLSLVARETLVYHSVSGEGGSPLASYVNLVPGRAGPQPWATFDHTQVVINILLGVPLGFGLNFLRRVRVWTALWVALGFGFTIEALQLVTSLIAGYPRHIADVNDLLLNAFGVGAGYALFRGVAWMYSAGTRHRGVPAGGLSAFLADVAGRDRDSGPR